MLRTSYNVPSCNPGFVALPRTDGSKYAEDPVTYAPMPPVTLLYKTTLILTAFKLNRSAYKSRASELLKLGKPWVGAPNERVE
jgi:hypothetical protein